MSDGVPPLRGIPRIVDLPSVPDVPRTEEFRPGAHILVVVDGLIAGGARVGPETAGKIPLLDCWGVRDEISPTQHWALAPINRKFVIEVPTILAAAIRSTVARSATVATTIVMSQQTVIQATRDTITAFAQGLRINVDGGDGKTGTGTDDRG